MVWNVLFDDECAIWFRGLERGLQKDILVGVELLEQVGPALGRDWVDTLKGSSIKNLKELRIQSSGEPWRVLFVFDPKRTAILLVGGNKQGDDRWYKKTIPIAEKRYEHHLKTLRGK